MALKDLLKLYGYYAANFISRGSLVNRESMSSLAIRAVHSKFLTRSSVTKVWVIKSFPVDFEYLFSYLIRSEMFKLYPESHTSINAHSSRVNPPVDKDIFKRQYAREEEKYNNLKSIYDQLSPSQRESGVKLGGGMVFRARPSDVKRQKDNYDSYRYVSKHTMGGGIFFNSYLFIQASGPSIKYMDKYRDSLESLLKANDIEFQEITTGMPQYLTNFGPAGYMQDNTKKFPVNLFSDENLAALLPINTRGLVGGKGTLFGFDWLSKQPLILNMFKTSSAQVFLIVAMAGSGKTAIAEFLTMSLAANKVHANIIDYKGGEYSKLDFAIDPLVIDIDGDDAPFVNLLRLDDVPVDKEDCEHIYNLAIMSTVELFSIISNITPKEGDKSDVEDAFEQAIKKAYSSLSGFNSKNPNTFSNTRNMRYLQVVDILSELVESKSLSYVRTALLKSVSKLRTFFSALEGNGSSKEITLADVLESETVIYSLNKNTSPNLTKRDSVRVFMAQHLSRKKHFVRAKQGLFTLEVYEEMTRVEEASTNSEVNHDGKRLLLFISQVVTGARSDNVIVFLLANNIKSLKTPLMQPIKSNITTLIAGKLDDEDISTLSTDFKGKSIEAYVRQISSGSSNFRNCFAIRFDNGDKVENAMFKAIFPDHMEKALRQRDVLDI